MENWHLHRSRCAKFSKIFLFETLIFLLSTNVCYVPLSQLRLPATLWMSYVQQPYSVLNSSLQLLQMHAYSFCYGVNPSPIYYSSFFAAFYFSQNYCFFQRTMPSNRYEVGKLRIWWSGITCNLKEWVSIVCV